ncbi:MAG: 6-carboxytetrahydropterin synthase [Saprospiraceae bacterium]|nr:6-carboxytetrahydropterin synthase [Saprospiraceae bacterium]|tara:strand:- start:130 stop:537 length:408 start_codon:yes stop_codon:yes gene_type:complete
MRISIFRKAHFNAAHRLYNPDWSDDKNWKVFGKCNNHNFHGHNYELEVKITGEIDPATGYVMNLKELKDIIKIEIENKFDHKNLNLDIPEFQDMMTSTENFCILIYNILKGKLNPDFDLTIRLYETPRNFVEYPA